MPEIPDEVIEAADAAYEAAHKEASKPLPGGMRPPPMSVFRIASRAAAKPIAAWAREQALADELSYKSRYESAQLNLQNNRDAWREAGARVAEVLALHKPRTFEVFIGECATEDCDHDDSNQHLTRPFEQCVECNRIANEMDYYYSETKERVTAWPCPTVVALRGKEGEPNDPGVRDEPTP